MKLAEALILRADLKTRAAQLRERLKSNAKVQEGETPSEDPQNLLREFEDIAAQMLVLIQLQSARARIRLATQQASDVASARQVSSFSPLIMKQSRKLSPT